MNNEHIIEKIMAREVLDSRGRPTVEVDVFTSGGSMGRATVPSGASKGSYEAHELRDGDSFRYRGLGVRKAISNINEHMRRRIIGTSVFEQERIDHVLIEMDGTPLKTRMGANAILGVSLATARAAAVQKKVSLYRYFHELSNYGCGSLMPVPLVNVISGGMHTRNGIDFQDYQIVPLKKASFSEWLRMISEIVTCTRDILLENNNPSLGLADEGGFCPAGLTNEEACSMIVKAMERAGFDPGKDMGIAVDFASNSFFREGKYVLKSENRILDAPSMLDRVKEFCGNYPVVSIEDPLVEDDWDGWADITRSLGGRLQIIGDDIFATNKSRMALGIKKSVANAVLIKMNQIGTITETLDALKFARDNSYRTVISARSGETEDSTISDMAVGTDAGEIKVGSVHCSSRLAKWNQLLRIEEELGGDVSLIDWSSLMGRSSGR